MMGERWALGVDIGSVTVKVLLLDEKREVRFDSYRRTMGAPLEALLEALTEARRALPVGVEIGSVGTTGSGRELAGAILGADVVKNEITAHAMGAMHCNPGIRTIIEIGGQDSKLIQMRDGMVADFAMNSVCAAGTGAFLDQQAERLRIPIESFGDFALSAKKTVRIAGRCCVFAESDMIHKQQSGHDRAEICLGLCQALVRNYLNNVAGGKRLEGPVSLQGGVAFNKAIVRCFREALPGLEIVLPSRVTGCGALGAALLGREEVNGETTRFTGWLEGTYAIREEPCSRCANQCDLFFLLRDSRIVAQWGGRCGRKSLRGRKKEQPCTQGA